MMRLDDYLKSEGLSQADFAKKLTPPVTQGLVSQWVRGSTRITLKQSLQIKRITKNRVTPEDCVGMYIGPQKRPRTPAQAQM